MWSSFQFLNDDCTLTILDIGAAITDVPNYQNPMVQMNATVVRRSPAAKPPWQISLHLKPIRRMAT